VINTTNTLIYLREGQELDFQVRHALDATAVAMAGIIEREGEEAKKELALTRERLLHSEEKCAQCAKAGAEAAAELSASRDAVSAAHRTLEALRQDLIAAQAELDVTRRSEAAWKEFAADGERLRKELQELSGRVAAAEAERRGLADRLDDANRARSHAEASANRLLEKLLNEEGSRMTMRDEGMNPDNPGNPDRAARSRPAGGRAEV
jgi:chromosome segregation ATPase